MYLRALPLRPELSLFGRRHNSRNRHTQWQSQRLPLLATSALTTGRIRSQRSTAATQIMTASASAVLTQQVLQATTTGVASSLNPSTSGVSVTFTATVTATRFGHAKRISDLRGQWNVHRHGNAERFWQLQRLLLSRRRVCPLAHTLSPRYMAAMRMTAEALRPSSRKS